MSNCKVYVLWCRIYRLCGLTKRKNYGIICVLNEKEMKMSYLDEHYNEIFKKYSKEELIKDINSYRSGGAD